MSTDFLTEGFSYVLMVVALLVTALVYPYVLAFAKKHHIVDNPDARKLQRVPVPVMGGTVVFIGFAIAVGVWMCFFPTKKVFFMVALFAVMYGIGVWDDRKDVSPAFRFLIEFIVIWMMMYLLKIKINRFYELWGIHAISDVTSVPFSLIAGVGIINSINLIDGVDGFCSTFGIFASLLFAVFFYYAGDMVLFSMALICIGALIPFFLHNVFGTTSKMFLGDGGSLMLGTLLAMFVISMLTFDSPFSVYANTGLCLPALTLAILAIPIFDTLKVMIFRMARGQSPFQPDKTHLHHLFIEMNFSHLMTSGIIIGVNFIIVCILLLSWKLGASVNLQMAIVVFFSLFFTWGFYFFMEAQHKKNGGEGSAIWKRWCAHGKFTQWSNTRVWAFLRRIVDSKFFAYGFMKRHDAEDAS